MTVVIILAIVIIISLLELLVAYICFKSIRTKQVKNMGLNEKAISRMKKQAQNRSAKAIFNLRLETSTIHLSTVEVIA